ncbi:hypothetical protein F5Y04DRAFT_255772 [Hypomontagnella monticulosa]|nr:hypothetical protein F5Y04DRAFT_255772 [Hypomontagnella monticulosa]
MPPGCATRRMKGEVVLSQVPTEVEVEVGVGGVVVLAKRAELVVFRNGALVVVLRKGAIVVAFVALNRGNCVVLRNGATVVFKNGAKVLLFSCSEGALVMFANGADSVELDSLVILLVTFTVMACVELRNGADVVAFRGILSPPLALLWEPVGLATPDWILELVEFKNLPVLVALATVEKCVALLTPLVLLILKAELMVLNIVESTELVSVLDVASAIDGLFSLYLSVDVSDSLDFNEALVLERTLKLEDNVELVAFRKGAVEFPNVEFPSSEELLARI